MPATTEVVKPNALATRPADYTPPSSPTLPPDQYTAMLQLIERGVTAVELLATAKTLPDSASPPETTEATATEQPESGEAKSRTSKVAYKKVDEV
jgi:hypothetical protein